MFRIRVIVGEYWSLNVATNAILVIPVTAHRCTAGLKKLDPRSGSQRHRHFVGFFNVPVQAPTRGHTFYTVILRNVLTEEVGPMVELPRHTHFVSFFYVSVQVPTRGQPFYGYSEKLEGNNVHKDVYLH